MATPTNIFIAYHVKDTEILDNLRAHLSPLERTEGVKIWYDGKVNAGSETLVEIRRAMSEADIILLLVSSNFIVSDFCYDTIMKNAIVMHNDGKVKVIPVIVRNCMWDEMPFSHLRKLPLGDIPITSWDNPDEPYTQIARELKKLISLRQASEQNVPKKKTRKRGRVLYRIPEKMQKNVASDCIIRIAPEDLPEEILKEALRNVDKVVIEDIRRIGKYMKVLLSDDSDQNTFLIKNKSHIEQVVEEDDYTEWQYEVTPLKEGRHTLLLTVSVTLQRDEFGKEYKDVIVLDREIDIITSEVNEAYDWHKVKEVNPLMLVHSNVGQLPDDTPPDTPAPTHILPQLRKYRRALSVMLLFLFFVPMVTWAAVPSMVTPIILNIQYDETRKLSDDRIAVKKDGKWGIVNKWGITSESPVYDAIKDYENDIVQVKKNGKWGALEKTEQSDDAWVKRVFSPKDNVIIPIMLDTIEAIVNNEVKLRIAPESEMITVLLSTDFTKNRGISEEKLLLAQRNHDIAEVIKNPTNISVTPPAIIRPKFTIDKTNIFIGELLRFTDQTPNSKSWLWNFGDGYTSSERNPTHVYNFSGRYEVTLSVNGERKNTYGQTITVVALRSVTVDSSLTETAPLTPVPYPEIGLATMLRHHLQEITRSNDDERKMNIYYNALLPRVVDDNITVEILRRGNLSKSTFYEYYQLLSMQGGQRISKVEVLNVDAEGRVTALRVLEQ